MVLIPSCVTTSHKKLFCFWVVFDCNDWLAYFWNCLQRTCPCPQRKYPPEVLEMACYILVLPIIMRIISKHCRCQVEVALSFFLWISNSNLYLSGKAFKFISLSSLCHPGTLGPSALNTAENYVYFSSRNMTDLWGSGPSIKSTNLWRHRGLNYAAISHTVCKSLLWGYLYK